MRVRDHISDVLSKNIPSARCIINGSEEILTTLHEDLAVDIQRTAVGVSNHQQIVNLGRIRVGNSGIRIYSGMYSGYSAPGSRIAGIEIQVFWNENSSKTNAY